MNNKDFATTLIVDQSPAEVFEAINNVRGWWSETIQESSKNLNDEFVYKHKDLHYSVQRLVEIIPDKKVVWLITDSSLSFAKKKDEWTGTKVIFDISKEGAKTQIRFTHVGLVPTCECFSNCSGGWNHYLKSSLVPLITTGIGKPDIK